VDTLPARLFGGTVRHGHLAPNTCGGGYPFNLRAAYQVLDFRRGPIYLDQVRIDIAKEVRAICHQLCVQTSGIEFPDEGETRVCHGNRPACFHGPRCGGQGISGMQTSDARKINSGFEGVLLVARIEQVIALVDVDLEFSRHRRHLSWSRAAAAAHVSS